MFDFSSQEMFCLQERENKLITNKAFQFSQSPECPEIDMQYYFESLCFRKFIEIPGGKKRATATHSRSPQNVANQVNEPSAG